jgi:serine/threonine-protein kinase PknK
MTLGVKMDSATHFVGDLPTDIAPEQLWKALSIVYELNRERDPNKLLEFILDAAVSLVRAERGFVILTEDLPEENADTDAPLTIRTARNFDKESIPEPERKVSYSIIREVLATGKTQIVDSALDHPTFSSKHSVRDQKLRSVLCMPLKVEEKIVGGIYLDNRFAVQVFGSAEEKLMTVFAAQAGVALLTARHLKMLEKLNHELSEHNNRKEVIITEQRSHIEVLDRELYIARDRVNLQNRYQQIRGQSDALRKVLSLIDRVAETDETVLVTGETGTGKELVANALHKQSHRRKHRFVPLNCPALSKELLESELFGHMKNSWTGAHAKRDGLFVAANKGTIFLDEITELPLELQAKLLRVLQEREVRPIGSNTATPIDVRVIAACNVNIEHAIKEGRFRKDLYYRLNLIPIILPPLRKRDGDVAVLAMHFLEDIAMRKGWSAPRRLTRGALQVLENYQWPGNVRQLKNEVERACLIGGETLSARDFQHLSQNPDNASSNRSDSGQTKRLEEIEIDTIKEVLKESNGHVRRAAKKLGIHHSTLYRKLTFLKIDPKAI